jgi:hypothetical protein
VLEAFRHGITQIRSPRHWVGRERLS